MSLTKDGKLGHFWSTDGRECLWCFRVRSAQEVKEWREAGEPFEECRHHK